MSKHIKIEIKNRWTGAILFTYEAEYDLKKVADDGMAARMAVMQKRERDAGIIDGESVEAPQPAPEEQVEGEAPYRPEQEVLPPEGPQEEDVGVIELDEVDDGTGQENNKDAGLIQPGEEESVVGAREDPIEVPGSAEANVEPPIQGSDEQGVTPQDTGEEWDGQTVTINGSPTIKNWASSVTAGRYLYGIMKARKTEEKRRALKNENLGLINQLIKDGDMKAVSAMSALITKGE